MPELRIDSALAVQCSPVVDVSAGMGLRCGGDAGSFSGDLLAPDRQENRLQWAEVAKGACIVLVVLWHVIMKHYPQIDWRVPVPLPGLWGAVSEQLLPLRMPLFFAISGFFAAAAVRRPWRVIRRSKVAKFLYLYVLWLCIHTGLRALVPDFGTERAGDLRQFLEQLTITPSNLWYLQALAIYFVAFVLSATAAAELVATPGNRGGVYQNLVFFLAGLYGKPLVERVATAASWRRFFAVGRCRPPDPADLRDAPAAARLAAPGARRLDRTHRVRRAVGGGGCRTRRGDRRRGGDLSCAVPDSAVAMAVRPARAARNRHRHNNRFR